MARELTKQFETLYRGSPGEIIERLTEEQTKGEFVVIVGNRKKDSL